MQLNPEAGPVGLLLMGVAAVLLAVAQAFKTVKGTRNGESGSSNTESVKDGAVWRASMFDLSKRQIDLLERTSTTLTVLSLNLERLVDTENKTQEMVNKTHSLIERRLIALRRSDEDTQ